MESPPRGSQSDVCDVLVVGGGINGTGIARDLSGRGLSVVLCEQADLASATSQWSTKLIHGGLRYLEYYKFMLVRKSLQEREVLMRCAPHLIRPLRFVMPHNPHMRPTWMIRLGLFLYDHLARRNYLPGSHAVDLRTDAVGLPLAERFTRGFAYSDGFVDDARLVIANAMDAREHGACILTCTRCATAHAVDGIWHAHLAPTRGPGTEIKARMIVNATGPWADRFIAQSLEQRETGKLRLIKGSHIVVPRMFDHNHAYILQNDDARIIFAIPYQDDYTLVGTTEVEFDGDPGEMSITSEEVTYLCNQANRYFKRQLSHGDVVWSFSGVRPLLHDDAHSAAAVTRDYRLELGSPGAPLLTVWGGKLTTYRKLAEEVAALLCRHVGIHRADWTHTAPLPGGDLQAAGALVDHPESAMRTLREAVARTCPRQSQRWVARVCAAYGGRVWRWLGQGDDVELGREVAPGLYEAELNYLVDQEWACSAADVLWRRTKLGLHYTPAERQSVEEWMHARQARCEQTTPESGVP